MIRVSASQYMKNLNIQADAATAAKRLAHYYQYLKSAINDEYSFVKTFLLGDNKKYDDKSSALIQLEAEVLNHGLNIASADRLCRDVNRVIAKVMMKHNDPDYDIRPQGSNLPIAAQIAIPNRISRYAVSNLPAGYVHSNFRPSWEVEYANAIGNNEARRAAADTASPSINWENEADGREKFTKSAGAVLLAALNAPASRSIPRITNVAGDIRPFIPTLTWSQSKEFLPKPLLNLIFDVRFQLVENDISAIIDERTLHEKSVRKITPNAPGTIRSWHEDSKGMLPDNGLHGKTNAQVLQAISANGDIAKEFHNHYMATSGVGEGAAAGAATHPVGFAEYTGAGTENIQDVKIVFDYLNGRIFLTLTHYQYWGILSAAAGNTYIPIGTQILAGALQRINDYPSQGLAVKTLMHPWIEILF